MMYVCITYHVLCIVYMYYVSCIMHYKSCSVYTYIYTRERWHIYREFKDVVFEECGVCVCDDNNNNNDNNNSYSKV